MAPTLPVELILQVINYAVETKDTPTLSALSRTSKWLCTITRPLLYESIKLHPVSKPYASGCFCRTIMENPELGLSVRDLQVDWFFDDWKKRNYQGILKAHLTPQDEEMGRLFEAKTERFRSLEGYDVVKRDFQAGHPNAKAALLIMLLPHIETLSFVNLPIDYEGADIGDALYMITDDMDWDRNQVALKKLMLGWEEALDISNMSKDSDLSSFKCLFKFPTLESVSMDCLYSYMNDLPFEVPPDDCMNNIRHLSLTNCVVELTSVTNMVKCCNALETFNLEIQNDGDGNIVQFWWNDLPEALATHSSTLERVMIDTDSQSADEPSAGAFDDFQNLRFLCLEEFFFMGLDLWYHGRNDLESSMKEQLPSWIPHSLEYLVLRDMALYSDVIILERLREAAPSLPNLKHIWVFEDLSPGKDRPAWVEAMKSSMAECGIEFLYRTIPCKARVLFGPCGLSSKDIPTPIRDEVWYEYEDDWCKLNGGETWTMEEMATRLQMSRNWQD